MQNTCIFFSEIFSKVPFCSGIKYGTGNGETCSELLPMVKVYLVKIQVKKSRQRRWGHHSFMGSPGVRGDSMTCNTHTKKKGENTEMLANM